MPQFLDDEFMTCAMIWLLMHRLPAIPNRMSGVLNRIRIVGTCRLGTE